MPTDLSHTTAEFCLFGPNHTMIYTIINFLGIIHGFKQHAIRWSDYIIGLVTLAIGPNKSKKLSRLIAPAHNIMGESRNKTKQNKTKTKTKTKPNQTKTKQNKNKQTDEQTNKQKNAIIAWGYILRTREILTK